MSLDICLRVESVQQLPVPGKFRVSPGGDGVGGEEHREHHHHCPPAPEEKHKVGGSKFNTFIVLESHQLFNLNILPWPGWTAVRGNNRAR